jgi:surface polysaccharide O-acyltransferase-like enzyme
MTNLSQRRDDIDIARAIAIFTVVLHHIPQYFVRYKLTYFTPELADAIVATVSYINIPLFMLVAGIVLGMRTRPSDVVGWWKFESKKFCRLMLPFLSISVIQLAMKMALLKQSTPEITYSLLAMVISPLSAPAPHLWFLYTLMCIFIIWPIFQKYASSKMRPILLTLLIIAAIAPLGLPSDKYGNSLFCLSNLKWYLPIFMLGYWHSGSAKAQDNDRTIIIIVAGVLFLTSLFICDFIDWPIGFGGQILRKSIRLTGHISCAFFFFGLCGILAKWNNPAKQWFKTIGFYSYDIYLLHVALVAHPLVCVISKLKPNIIITYVWFLIAVIITTLLPIFLGKMIRLLPVLAFVMLGIPRKPVISNFAGVPRL